jgi:hypothetical protein
MTKSRTNSRSLYLDLGSALAGGLVTALVTTAVVVFVGAVGAGKAKALLEATLPTTRFLCSAVMTASATTLALMLTLLSLSTGVEGELASSHYQRVKQIALMDVIAFVGATILLVTLIVPFGENISVPIRWYTVIYYVVSIGAGVLAGMLVAVVIMLYTTVRDVIRVLVDQSDS